MNELRAIGEEFGLYVIEDAAESLGSRYRGGMTGTLGKAGVFSFYGNKLISTGEGGMLATNDDELARSAAELRTHGRPLARHSVMTEWQRPYFHDRAGFNYRMMELQGALGVAQLERIDVRIEERRQLRALYEEALGRYARWQAAPLGCDVVWWMNAALVDWPAAMALRLREAGIETRPVFWPLDGLPVAWRSRPKSGAARSMVAERIHRSGIVLPSHGRVRAEDVEKISELIISGSRKRP